MKKAKRGGQGAALSRYRNAINLVKRVNEVAGLLERSVAKIESIRLDYGAKLHDVDDFFLSEAMNDAKSALHDINGVMKDYESPMEI